ncbi:MAG: hypothetical protein M1833_003872 [Piccolia ochrophora]|nr:MAG: hypothetical protein M1833_003872 [Piccolia ochrophora]
MDPLSTDPELANLSNAFHQGQYTSSSLLSPDPSNLTSETRLPARILSLRARIASGQADEALSDLKGESSSSPELAAVKALAQYSTGNTEEAVKTIEELASSASENATVQLLGGTILQVAGKSEEALALLSKHQGNLEAVALIVQIHLQQNRTDLALKEVQAAKRWAQDSLLVNIAESWVGLRVGGDSYQSAFYVFEELAQAPSSTATKSLISQAIAELHLGRLPEAEAALQQALEREPKNADAIANSVVLAVVGGKDTGELVSSLRNVDPDHPFLRDLQEKSELFDKAATKYSPSVAAA